MRTKSFITLLIGSLLSVGGHAAEAVEATAGSVVQIFGCKLKEGQTGGDRKPDALIETFSCRINEGSTMADVDKAIEFWQAQVRKSGIKALDSYDAYLWTPIRGGSGADFAWVGNAPSLNAWAQGLSAFAASGEGRATQARFDGASTCTNGLWYGYWITAPQQF